MKKKFELKYEKKIIVTGGTGRFASELFKKYKTIKIMFSE